jgi:hypothetical protein
MDNCCPSDQSDSDRLIGTWKIVSIVSDVVDPNGRTTSHPANWHGYLALTAAHRAIIIQAAKDRPIPDTDDEYIYAFCSMIAYSGKYVIIANKVVITVDIAWNEGWNGTEQILFYRFENNQLIIEDELKSYPDIPGAMIRVIWTCKRDCLGIH